MSPKQCRTIPGRLCVYGPCYFGGACHIQAEARREAISAGEAEYLSWLAALRTNGVGGLDHQTFPPHSPIDGKDR